MNKEEVLIDMLYSNDLFKSIIEYCIKEKNIEKIKISMEVIMEHLSSEWFNLIANNNFDKYNFQIIISCYAKYSETEKQLNFLLKTYEYIYAKYPPDNYYRHVIGIRYLFDYKLIPYKIICNYKYLFNSLGYNILLLKTENEQEELEYRKIAKKMITQTEKNSKKKVDLEVHLFPENYFDRLLYFFPENKLNKLNIICDKYINFSIHTLQKRLNLLKYIENKNNYKHQNIYTIYKKNSSIDIDFMSNFIVINDYKDRYYNYEYNFIILHDDFIEVIPFDIDESKEIIDMLDGNNYKNKSLNHKDSFQKQLNQIRKILAMNETNVDKNSKDIILTLFKKEILNLNSYTKLYIDTSWINLFNNKKSEEFKK